VAGAYSWTSAQRVTSTQANPYVSQLQPTTYALTETNSNGCINSNSVKITVNPLPAAGVIAKRVFVQGLQ